MARRTKSTTKSLRMESLECRITPAAADLDLTFGTFGTVTTNIRTVASEDSGNAVAVQADGKIIVVGNSYPFPNTHDNVAIARFNADGTLDATFGTSGKVTTEYGPVTASSQNYANGVAVQADGKIVVVGSYRTDNQDFFGVARYNSNGTLDETFDADGKLTAAFFPFAGVFYSAIARGVAIQTDGKIVVAGVTSDPVNKNRVALARFNSDGSFDTTFDGDGKAVSNLGLDEEGQAVALDASGRIIVAGYSVVVANPFDTYDLMVARFLPNGSIDTTFDTDGYKVTTLDLRSTFASVAIQNDGKIVSGGESLYKSAFDGNYTKAVIARYNVDGSLDATFNNDGIATLAFTTTDANGIADSDALFRSVSVQANGKIIAAGGLFNRTSGSSKILVARYNADGFLDDQFDGDGKLAFGSGSRIANATFIQPDGKIVIAGEQPTFAGVVLARLTGDPVTPPVNTPPVAGNDDATTPFQTAAVINVLANDSDADGDPLTVSIITQSANGSAVVNADKTVTFTPVAGFSGTTSFTYQISDGRGGTATASVSVTVSPAPAVAGTLDTTFGSSGNVFTSIAGTSVTAAGLEIDGSERIYVAGVLSSGDFTLFRYTANGILDTTFGTSGMATADLGQGDTVTGMAIQPDGKVVVAGFTFPGTGAVFALVRFNADGTLDTTFGTGGKVTTAFDSNSNSSHAAYAVALQPDGKIILVGSTASSIGTDIAVARYNPDGSLDTTFDADGKVTTDLFGSTDYAYAVAVQSDGKIVVGGTSYRNTASNFSATLVRYNPDGSIDTSFDTDGKASVDFSATARYDGVNSIAIQPDGRIVIAAIGNDSDFCLARFTSDGVLDASFDSDGKTLTDFNGDGGTAFDLSIQNDGKIVVVGSADTPAGTPGIFTNFVVARYIANGSLDPSFSSDGKVTVLFNPSASVEKALNVALQPDGKILVAGYSDAGTREIVLARFNAGSIVAPTNTVPIAGNDTTTTPFQTPKTINVLANDSDPDNDPLTVSIITQPANGNAVVNSDNTVTFTPATGFSGTTRFTYQISDGRGGNATATATIIVSPDPSSVQHLEVVGAGVGGGPRVRATRGDGTVILDLFAFEPRFTGGVRVAAGDINGDGFADIIAAAGEGGGPRIRIFDGQNGAVLKDFFAFESTLRNGTFVAAADVNSDGRDDLVVSAGVGGGPRVTVFDGVSGVRIRDFFAFDASDRGGVTVSAGAVLPGGGSGLAIGQASGRLVRLFDLNAKLVGELPTFNSGYRGGVTVAPFENGFAVGTLASASRIQVFDASASTPVMTREFAAGTGVGGARLATGNTTGTLRIGTGGRVKSVLASSTTLQDESNPFGSGFLGGIWVGSGHTLTGFA